MGGYFKKAEFVRKIESGEKICDLINECKSGTWSDDAEYLVLQLVTGERLMVRGGRDGIDFEIQIEGGEQHLVMELVGKWVRVRRIYGHTHPVVTGPSDGDMLALIILKQRFSYIFEIGGDPHGTRFRPK